MSPTRTGEPRDPHDDGRPRMRAVVGSDRIEEEIFGRAFDGKVVRRIWDFVGPYRNRVWIAVAAVIIFTLSQLSIPLLIRFAIDHGMAADAAPGTLTLIVGLFALAIVINYIASLVQERVTGRMAEHVLFDIRRKMFGHLQRVSLSFMDKTEVGRLMSRLQGDVNSMQEFLETSIMSVGDILLLVGIVVVMLWLDWQLAAMVLMALPILFGVRVLWLSKARAAFMAAHEANSVTNGALAEAIHGVRAVQAMDRAALNAKLYGELVDTNYASHLRASRLAQIMIPIVDSLTGIAMAVVVVAGGLMVVSGRIEVGVMVAFLFYIQRFFDPIRSLTMQYSVMQRAMASGHRLTEVLDVEVSVEDAPDAVALTKDDDGSVEFRNVTFGYNPKHPVLKDVSFKVNSGETVALVGPTGSGKSSSMSLIHRFYDVQDGAVMVGGKDVRDVTQHSLGRHIAMVLQEPYLFTGTVMDNIRYSSHWATDEDVIEATKAVGAHDFVAALPHGYDTMLEERGSNLSLGQRQLLSFARALVADAKILVLDEATANIDSYTEMLIQKALQTLLEGRTGLVIAHRLATIRNADRIVVLQQGSLIEEGNHDALMAKNGLYSKLYSLNYASFDDLPDDLSDADRAMAT
ncbi:ABC transporter ATP-binding protein [Psychromarinibacter halotolerans]|uniref:ABC transporter ATP-binding protein n=1 Tax=Psychromarinibacter halotolerans TaxID=1775175 RepID=A0ABV7GN42_9RHOB|nr:ABC transporter ATP-binding protein [Psychromarinibacter halotolerans]MDF0596804.1 ABC transporter ATP-binding protein [Psychromarinibacter halotolerans]